MKNRKFFVFNVRDNAGCRHLFLNVYFQNESPYVYILGDFNANILRINSVFVDDLKTLCIRKLLILNACVKLPVDSFTYVSEGNLN